MKISYKFLFSLLILVLVNILCFGQPDDPTDGGDPCPGFPNCVPIDGGIGFLIAAGFTLVGKKLWNLK